MELKKRQDTGSLHISEAVIEKIANTVVEEIDGVADMGESPSHIKDIIFRSQRRKPILIKMNAGVATIDVFVCLQAGYRIKEVAEQVQQYTKETVQNMTAVTVSKVNVYIQGVKATV